MEVFLFLLLPLSGIGLLFLNDKNKERKKIMNLMLVMNILFFFSPLMKAYFNSPSGESMWNENTGGGAYIWLYIIVLPVSALIQLILIVLKIIFASRTQ